MVVKPSQSSNELFHADETAWLDETAELLEHGLVADLDHANLGEYLRDMARRDRREVENRLAILLAHLLKWIHQPERRSGGWRATILVQGNELAGVASRGVLRNHLEASLADAYGKAIDYAAAETELEPNTFPSECPWTTTELFAVASLLD